MVDPVSEIEEPLSITDPNMSFARNVYPPGNVKVASHSNKITIEPKEEPFDPQFLLSQERAEKVKGGSRKKSLKKRRKTKRKGAGPKKKKKSVSIPPQPITRLSYIREGDSAWDEYADDDTYRGRVVYLGNPQLSDAQRSVLNFRQESRQPELPTDSPVTRGLKQAYRNKYLNDVPPPSPPSSPPQPIQSAIQSPIITPDDYYELAEDLKSPPKSVINMSDVTAAQRILNEERERRKAKKAVGSRRAMKMAKYGKKGGRKSLKKSKRKGGMDILRKRQDIDNRKTKKTYTPNTSTYLAEERRRREEQKERLAEEKKRREQLLAPTPLRRTHTRTSLSRMDEPKEESDFSVNGSVFKSLMKGYKRAEKKAKERTKRDQERIKKANEERERVEKEIEKLKGGRRKSLKKRRKN